MKEKVNRKEEIQHWKGDFNLKCYEIISRGIVPYLPQNFLVVNHMRTQQEGKRPASQEERFHQNPDILAP